ncbi:unnamed protein product [Caenorhabditis sp. 36 PRJEB53466]|nr:unnamed protein product [Caenorhabditis sp. 36 PRJEB53466]
MPLLVVLVVNLISCVVIATFCSANDRKCERGQKEAEEKRRRDAALLMISDNFLDPDDPESSSLRGVSSEAVFPNTVTSVPTSSSASSIASSPSERVK